MVGNGLFHSAKRYNKKQRDTILWKDRFIILGMMYHSIVVFAFCRYL